MKRAVPGIELSRLVDVLLELEAVKDLLSDAAELTPAAQGDGEPLVRLWVTVITPSKYLLKQGLLFPRKL